MSSNEMDDYRRELLDAAVNFTPLAVSVIPLLPAGKQPAILWREFQKVRADEAQIREWWSCEPRNIGIITGVVSNIVVVDVDGPEGAESITSCELPETAKATTGNGMHYYYKHPDDQHPGLVRGRVRILPGVDIRGDGNYVVAPPSQHPNGNRYAWVEGHSIYMRALAPCPDWLLKLIVEKQKNVGFPLKRRSVIAQGVSEGERHNALIRLTGNLLGKGIDAIEVCELMLGWNMRCRPPLEDDEVVSTVASLCAAELGKLKGGK